jgi:DNA mismatch repair ATPase MutS
MIALLLGTVFSSVYRRRVQAAIQALELPGRDLGLFARLLERLERESYESPPLVELRAALDTKGLAPSACIARLRRLIDLLDARRNQLFIPVAVILLWTPQLALAIERWRAVYGEALELWIAAVGEFEALCALAGFSYEHPDYPFPEIVEESVSFEGIAIGHPLLPADRCVRNDVKLVGDQQLLIVSGSNMSGKSTLLRTIGTNTVLGLSGAPVCAQHLRISPLAIGASIRLQDSLQEGSSRFYAEILRLRQIADLSQGELPALFLLDEILHGTNSHDRGIGAEAVLRNLLENGAIGLITTHDLALTQVAEVLAPRAVNVHFQDHLEDGEIAFDYRMHDGIVAKSNALELMRAVGLEV